MNAEMSVFSRLTGKLSSSYHFMFLISLFALQPSEPSDGCFALRKLMANG
jgi:hypothetical protein